MNIFNHMMHRNLISLLIFLVVSSSCASPNFTFFRPTATSTITATSTPTSTPTHIPTATQTPTPTQTPVFTNNISVYTYTIIATYPHDHDAFTQGLVFEDGIFYEGTGLYEQSSLRKVAIETGQVQQIYELPKQFFGEGLTIYEDKIIQLTWKSQIGFVYNKDTFALLRQFRYPTEGWGLTHDGHRLVMSDGTATIYFLSPDTLELIGQINVHINGKPVTRLNELEYIKGEVYANIWQTEQIVSINLENGNVTGLINLTGLLRGVEINHPVDVLNGIAYDEEHDRLFVTGKWWPVLFEIELVPR